MSPEFPAKEIADIFLNNPIRVLAAVVLAIPFYTKVSLPAASAIIAFKNMQHEDTFTPSTIDTVFTVTAGTLPWAALLAIAPEIFNWGFKALSEPGPKDPWAIGVSAAFGLYTLAVAATWIPLLPKG